MKLKVSELKKLLRKAGCRQVDEGSNHEIWYSPITEMTFTVPRHQSQDVKKGLCEGIKKQAGLK